MAFAVPSGYDCITTSGGNTLSAYGGGFRDTYTLIGFDWVKTAHSNYNYGYGDSVCYAGDKIIPSSIQAEFILPAVIIVLCFFKLILNMFMGVRR